MNAATSSPGFTQLCILFIVPTPRAINIISGNAKSRCARARDRRPASAAAFRESSIVDSSSTSSNNAMDRRTTTRTFVKAQI